MKQSLHSYFPRIISADSIKELLNTNYQIILFDQSSNLILDKNSFDSKTKYLFIFGPEGSLSDNEIKTLNPNLIFNLGSNRLRSETAIVKCASILSEMVKGG
jgi:RsmE family RNA methyltransferase